MSSSEIGAAGGLEPIYARHHHRQAPTLQAFVEAVCARSHPLFDPSSRADPDVVEARVHRNVLQRTDLDSVRY